MFRVPIQAEYRVYSINDPAVDQDKSDVLAYNETLDPSKLVWREGEIPSVFCLRTPSLASQRAISARHRELVGVPEDKQEMQRRSLDAIDDLWAIKVRATLRRVENFEGLEIPEPGVDGLLPESVLEQLGNVFLIAELGHYSDMIAHNPPRRGPSGDVEPCAGQPQ